MIQTKEFAQGSGSPWQNIVIADYLDKEGRRYVYNVGGFGCYLTCLTSLLWAFQIATDPGKFATALKSLPSSDGSMGGFTIDGLVENDCVNVLYPQVFFVKGVSTALLSPAGGKTMGASFIEIKRLLKMGMPVIIQVDASPNDGQNRPTHFILLVDWNNGDPLCMDPIYGKIEPLSKRYGTPEKAIYGYRVFVGPPVSIPEGGDISAGVTLWKTVMAKSCLAKKDYALAKQYIGEAIENFIN